MEYYYKGEKTTEDLIENLANLFEEEEHPYIEENLDLIIEMIQKNKFPKYYYKENIIDFDKIIEDEEFLNDHVGEYLLEKKGLPYDNDY